MNMFEMIVTRPLVCEDDVVCPSFCVWAVLCWRLSEDVPSGFPWLCLVDKLEENIKSMPAELWNLKTNFTKRKQTLEPIAV
ncbi:MAG: hypothetical protein ACOY16_13860 [Chloroflexota bacterium]